MPYARKNLILNPGRKITKHYQVIDFVGCGWEGEVYRVEEIETGIIRAAKLFYPHRYKGKAKPHIDYAKKLHRLRACDIVIQYHHQISTKISGSDVDFLVSDFVDGEPLSRFLNKQRSGHLLPFEALHLFYALVKGVAQLHTLGEYHGDIHSDNIMVKKVGLGFEVSFIDFIHLGRSTSQKIQDDVIDLIAVFYEMIGGSNKYGKMPQQVKHIICGRKHYLIKNKFKTAGDIKLALEQLTWEIV